MNSRHWMAYCLVSILILVLPTSSHAQVIGCSVVPSTWVEVQQGLDAIFLGACGRHDACYRDCNPVGGPYHAWGYKSGCDAILYAELLASCQVWSLILGFPNIEWVDSGEFMEDCSYVAAGGYVAVSVGGRTFYLNNQCARRNVWACNQQGVQYNQTSCDVLCGNRDPLRPSPILIDLQGNGPKLTGPMPAVYFDLDADGVVDHTSWTRMQTKDGFLVLDRNRNGIIDDGQELFGDSTPMMLSAKVADHGYRALEEFDRFALGGNEDGAIDSNDAIFEHLQIWLDLNRDAATQDGELKWLAEVGVSAISLAYFSDDQEDQWGNVFKWWSPVYFEDGSESMSTDVFFALLSE